MNPQNYRKDRKMFRDDPIADSALELEPVPSQAPVLEVAG